VSATFITTTADHSPVDPTFTDAINALAHPLRDVVLLRDVGGLSARTIGSVLGIGKAQAQVALLHARRAVRQRLLEPAAAPAPAFAVARR
jgi:DNA-directed RNA polymerase specialized sigma24 family protein